MAFDPNTIYFADGMPAFMMEIADRPFRTALNYAKDYLAFFTASAGEMTPKTVEDFLSLDAQTARKRILAYYASRRSVSPATLCRMASALRTLVATARLHNATALSPHDIPRPARKAEAYRDTSGVSADELRSMVKAAEDVRDKILVVLLGALGLRRFEVAALKVSDYKRLVGGGTLMVAGKGMAGQKTMVAIPDDLCQLIDQYLENRGKCKPNSPLLLGRHKSGISEVGINFVVHTLAALAGIAKEASPHRLRHSAATIALDGGLDVSQVQALMRHKSVKTTQVYDDNKKRYDGVAAMFNTAKLLS